MSNEMIGKTKRSVLITGGSRGIGESCVRRFAESGDRVAFIYRTSTEKAEKLSSETGAFAVRADLSDPAEASAAVERAVRLMGGIDVLVCNAGISEFSLFTDITDDAWRRMIDTDLSSAFYSARETSRLMIHEKTGKIVFISSMWGLVGASCEVHYSAAKAGIVGMTKALAKELGPSNINVNCVCPGVIDTDMNAHLTEADITALCDETPLCRIGKPSEVAEAVFFLASENASFITGQTLSVDGGFAV